MAKKNYTVEFRRRAVDLYETTSGATLRGIAADLGVSRGALHHWVERFGSGSMRPGPAAPVSGRSEPQSARIVRLEAELSVLRAEARKLETERDILRQAAKYFAGETNW